MTDLPAPPYPAETRAKGWRFELDYEQIERSDTWPLAAEIPMAQHALLMMWLMAWGQEPCGTFPNDEAVIRAKCRIPPATWAKCRDVLMRGWWLASDGRLYHDTLVKRVQEMMARRRSDSDRQAAKRARDAAESLANPDGVTPVSRVTPPGLTPESSTDNRQPTEDISKASPSHPPAKATGTKTPTVPCPYDAIVAAYHEALPGLPAVRLMPVKRQAAMRKAWGWVLSSTKPDGRRRAESADEALAWFRSYFGRAGENDFLMGRSARPADHAGWQCDLDFLLTDRGMSHVIEKTQDAA